MAGFLISKCFLQHSEPYHSVQISQSIKNFIFPNNISSPQIKTTEHLFRQALPSLPLRYISIALLKERCPEVSLLKLVSHPAQNLNLEETGVQGTLICISLITSETELFFT